MSTLLDSPMAAATPNRSTTGMKRKPGLTDVTQTPPCNNGVARKRSKMATEAANDHENRVPSQLQTATKPGEEQQQQQQQQQQQAVVLAPTELGPASESDTVPRKKYEVLKAKYEKLKQLRHSEAEACLAGLEKASKAREKASADLIDHLRRENALLKKKGATTTTTTTASKATNEMIQGLEAELSSTSSVATLYQYLTSLQAERIILEDDEEGESRFRCRLNGMDDESFVSFEIVLNKEGEVEYFPLDIGLADNRSLPDFVTEDIVFDVNEAAVFFFKLLVEFRG